MRVSLPSTVVRTCARPLLPTGTSKLVCGAAMMFSKWAREFKTHANIL